MIHIDYLWNLNVPIIHSLEHKYATYIKILVFMAPVNDLSSASCIYNAFTLMSFWPAA